MKKNNQSNKKIKKAEAVRQAVAAEQARRLAAEKAAKKAEAIANRRPMHATKKVLFGLVAASVAFAIAAGTFGLLALNNPLPKEIMTNADLEQLSAPSAQTAYEQINLKKLLNIPSSMYQGQTIRVSQKALYTEADMPEYMKNLLYENRIPAKVGSALTVRNGDDLSIYILEVTTKDGEKQFTDLFANQDYTSPATFSVGNNVFGNLFDEKVVGLTLSDATLIQQRNVTALQKDDVVAMVYGTFLGKVKQDETTKEPVLKEDGTPEIVYGETLVQDDTALTSNGCARVDLSLMKDEQRDALMAAFQVCGQEFVYEYTFTEEIEVDGQTETVTKYAKTHAMIDFVAQEQVKEITFSLPTDFSSKTETRFKALDGQEITMRFIIGGIGNYEDPAWTADFIKNTMGFETDLTGDTEVYNAFVAHTMQKLNEQITESNRRTAISMAYATIAQLVYADTANSTVTTPQELYEVEYRAAYQEIVSAYVSANGAEPSSTEQLDQYVKTYCQQMANQGDQNYAQITTTAQYCQAKADGNVKQKMVMTYIFEQEKSLTISEEELAKAYREYVDSLIASYGNLDGIDEVYFVRKYGYDTLLETARGNLIYNLVGDYLLENNTVTR